MLVLASGFVAVPASIVAGALQRELGGDEDVRDRTMALN